MTVIGHLILSFIHGSAHDGADVALPPWSMLFVLVVILAGPVVGLALVWPAPRLGAWVVAVTMGASLLFGVVNHFLLPGPDHVAHVAEPWRRLFATTAALLAVTEALGCSLALRMARQTRSADDAVPARAERPHGRLDPQAPLH